MAHILIVDDEKSIREALKDILSIEGYTISEAEDGKAGLEILLKEKSAIDLVLCDVKMPKMDGIELLEAAQSEGFSVPFVMISAHATIDVAVDATRKGAFDFIQKPPDLNRLLLTIRNGLDKSTLVAETKILKKKISKIQEIIGESLSILSLKETIDKVAPTDARVLITGENGTGKELVARWLHEKSNRSGQPLVEVNCAAIPSELIESELFGHEKGSFTSAVKQRIGKFEQANGGTLFLDEIGDMSLSAQAKVLRALQEHTVVRVGGEQSIKINVRVFAATNKNLKEEIQAGNFREDLYHRLSVIIIQVPPLRERSADISLLVNFFLNQIAEEYGTTAKMIEASAIRKLENYKWTGNIRELRNVVERLIIMSSKTITLDDVNRYAIL